MDRRKFLTSTAALASVSLAGQTISAKAQRILDHDSEEYWQTIIDQYEVPDHFINLNAGHWGMMSKPVLDAFIEHTKFVNSHNSQYIGHGVVTDPDARNYGKEYGEILAMLAKRLGVGTDEIVITRNATESMQLLISGYNKLKAGDTVLYTDKAYGTMMVEMRNLKALRGTNVVQLKVPHPATYENQIAVFEQGIKENPKTKLILVTHMSNQTGVIVPIKEIQRMARGCGVDVIVDMAHSFGQYDYDFADLDLDFVGFNLHKWIGAALGVGLMYIKKDRIKDIDKKLSFGPDDNEEIRFRALTGTMNMAIVLSIKDALYFLDDIGIKHIDRRFKALRDQWVKEFLDDDRVDILNPEDDRMHAGLTTFRINAIENARELGKTLYRDYRINTTTIGNLSGVRIAPGLHNSLDEMDKLAAAIKEIASKQ